MPATSSTRRCSNTAFARGDLWRAADDGLKLVEGAHRQCGALRAAAEQADAGRDRHLPAVPDRGLATDMPRPCAPSSRSAASPTSPRSRRWACGAPRRTFRPRRGARDRTPPRLYRSYHCSRYNTNTGVLTADMFRAVFAAVRADLDRAPEESRDDARICVAWICAVRDAGSALGIAQSACQDHVGFQLPEASLRSRGAASASGTAWRADLLEYASWLYWIRGATMLEFFSRHAHRFVRDNDGNFVILTALAMVPLLAAASVAVDLHQCRFRG